MCGINGRRTESAGRNLLIIALLAAAAWHWHDRSSLSEREVVALYKAQAQAWHTQNGELLCEQLADDFEGTVRAVYGSDAETTTTGKDAACAGIDAILNLKAAADSRLPEDEQLGWNYRFEIKSIRIDAGKKSAGVDVSTHMNMGKLLIVDSDGTDTVALRDGKPVFVGGDASARYSGVALSTVSFIRTMMQAHET